MAEVYFSKHGSYRPLIVLAMPLRLNHLGAVYTTRNRREEVRVIRDPAEFLATNSRVESIALLLFD